MSLYNMINGYNPAVFWVLPMLSKSHPDVMYPRFRDCFIGEMSRHPTKVDEYGIPSITTDTSKKVISIFTRVGGGNRSSYIAEIKGLKCHPNYIKDYDDSFDSTFATFLFSVPEEFINDYDLIVNDRLKDVSEKYKERLYQVYPKLKEQFDTVFNS